MNSLGVSPYVNCLSSDLADGLIIFQLYEIISPGCVEWNKVTRKFSRMKKFMEKIQNCNYVVELGRKQKYVFFIHFFYYILFFNEIHIPLNFGWFF